MARGLLSDKKSLSQYAILKRAYDRIEPVNTAIGVLIFDFGVLDVSGPEPLLVLYS